MLNLPAIAVDRRSYRLGRGSRVSPARRRGPASGARVAGGRSRASGARMGSYDFAAQYQQEPIPLDGGSIKCALAPPLRLPPRASRPAIRSCRAGTPPAKAEEINDYSVCTTWLRRGKEHYLLDVVRAAAGLSGAAARGIELACSTCGRRRPDRGQGLGHPADPGSARRSARSAFDRGHARGRQDHPDVRPDPRDRSRPCAAAGASALARATSRPRC